MNIKKIIIIMALPLCFAACNQNSQGTKTETEQDILNNQGTETEIEQDIRWFPGKYVADEPENVTEYLENLCREGKACVVTHSYGDDHYKDSLSVWQAIRHLDDYANGRRAYYPTEEIQNALGLITHELAYDQSHGCPDEMDTTPPYVFFYRFLEQAVRLSPEVDYVTGIHCADGTAGILGYGGWGLEPLFCFLVYPTAKGLRVTMVGEIGNTGIDKLFHLTDNAGREYYLCSNNGGRGDYLGYYFCQYLFMRDGDKLKEVASVKDLPNNFRCEKDVEEVIFNPQKLRWDCCWQNGDIWVRVEGTKSLSLKLDGINSRFKVESAQ